MKWLIRSFVFLAALFLGVFAYAITLPNGLSHCVVDLPQNEAHQNEPANLAPMPTEIEVLYAGQTSDGSLRFLIVNGTDHEIYYLSSRPHAILTVNGKVVPNGGGCGNEIKTSYYIPSGSSAEVKVLAHEFLDRPKKSTDATVGFQLYSPAPDKSGVYMSEKFRLPDQFRTAIHPFRD